MEKASPLPAMPFLYLSGSGCGQRRKMWSPDIDLVIQLGPRDQRMKNIIFVIAALLLLAPEALAQNSTADWPTPKFRFEVEYTFDGKAYTFEVQEITGLDPESSPIEYRKKGDPNFTVQKMPGLKKFSDITLIRGLSAPDNKLFDWYRSIRETTKPMRGTVIIKLLDEDGNPTMTWKLENAFPKKVVAVNENAGSFESIVFAHEGIMLKQQ
jgi:phage tail-like protein